MASEKRSYRRFRSNRVQLRVPDRATLHAALRDVSEGGLFIETPNPPLVGEHTRLELFPPGWPQPLLLTGKVVRAELTGYAVRLDAPNEKARMALQGLVAQVASEQSSVVLTSLPEAQQKLSIAEAELRDLRDKLTRAQAAAEQSRAFLERGLAQTGAQGPKKGSRGLLAVAVVGGFLAGVVVATVVSVARTPPPEAPRPDLGPARQPSVKSMEDHGPKRPSPLPMAAIFDSEGADAGTAVDAGTRGAAPSRPTAAAKPAVAAADTGTLNFLANTPAQVLIDFKPVGTTPLRGYTLKSGSYRVQFVCKKGATPSAARLVTVQPFTETEVQHRCD